jgi:hypothetical protein
MIAMLIDFANDDGRAKLNKWYLLWVVTFLNVKSEFRSGSFNSWFQRYQGTLGRLGEEHRLTERDVTTTADLTNHDKCYVVGGRQDGGVPQTNAP